MAKEEGISKDEYTIKEHRFRTEDGEHVLYVQEWGNSKGSPVLFLHGGPGAGCWDKHKNNFDPKKNHVIFLDQRGSGRSKPKGSIKANTTQHLVNDIELIRKKLNIKNFSIYGNSWGSTLALCYGIAYPDRVKNMIISGIFLGTDKECGWFERVNYKDFFPEIWEMYIEDVPKQHLDNPGAYHAEQIKKGSKKSAYQYTEAEGLVLSLDDRNKPSDFDAYDRMSYAKILSHYISNRCFLEDEFVLKNAHKLTMPINIVQGRYDMVCPPINAYRLHKTLPDSKLYWSLAGHKGSDRSSHDILKTLIDIVY